MREVERNICKIKADYFYGVHFFESRCLTPEMPIKRYKNITRNGLHQRSRFLEIVTAAFSKNLLLGSILHT